MLRSNSYVSWQPAAQTSPVTHFAMPTAVDLPATALLDSHPPERVNGAIGFSEPLPGRHSAQRLLALVARAWCTTAVAGQFVFALYITLVYGGAVVTGDHARWNTIMRAAYVPGRTLGNAAIAAHVLLAVFIILGGALQLLPTIRRRAPSLHRWVGRAFMTSVLFTSVVGLYMVWIRDSGAGDLSQHVAISGNAAILCGCAVMAWRAARARDFVTHRQWALRAFLAAGGVYFFRLGVFLWLAAWRRPVGFDAETFSGPFLTTLAFAVYVVVPLSVLQLYFVAQKSRTVLLPCVTAAALTVITLLTAAGIVSASLIFWLPRM